MSHSTTASLHKASPVKVSLRGVEKSYDGKTKAVSALNLDIGQGEFLSLLGPSGSGKTTCLMMLAGFEEPTGGQILLGGHAITSLPPYRRNIGVVFQNYALFPHMTVARNVAYPLQMRGMKRDEVRRRLDDTLALVGLKGFEERYPRQLSGGQQQRVALARALVFEPDMVLMDEPLGALDKQLREQMQYEIKRIHNRLGLTAVSVTHDQAEALTMSDRIAVFRNGHVDQIGTAAEIYEHPQTAFVAEFVGENNRLDGTVVSFERLSREIMTACGPVKVTSGGTFARGDKVALYVRPERIEIEPNSPASNAFDAVITDKFYLGDHVRMGLLLRGAVKVHAKAPVTSAGARLPVGTETKVGWGPDDCTLLQP